MIGQRLCRALDLERRAYPANASPPGARWESGSLASLISFAICSCPPRGTWLGRKVTQSPTKGSLLAIVGSTPVRLAQTHLSVGTTSRRAKREFEPHPHAAMLRAGGAMNSGPTGSVIVSRRIRSISALAGASSRQPVTSSTGCN